MALINLMLAKFYVKAAMASANESMSFLERIKPPVNITEEGLKIDYLFNFTTALITFFFILVVIGLFGFSYFYQHKKHPKPLYVDGTSKKHILIVAFIGSMVFVLIDMQITSISNRDYLESFINWPDETKEDVVKVEVLGQQWAWNFRLAGKDGLFNTEDDIVSLNEVHLPIGKKVVFQVTSKDVIHSFSIPNARMKVDAMPGRISRMWQKFTLPGSYTIACSQMCGTYHYRMQGRVILENQKEHEIWLASAQANAPFVVDKDSADVFWGWKWITTAKNN
jgi:cytochrome c oxidase subunit 2